MRLWSTFHLRFSAHSILWWRTASQFLKDDGLGTWLEVIKCQSETAILLPMLYSALLWVVQVIGVISLHIMTTHVVCFNKKVNIVTQEVECAREVSTVSESLCIWTESFFAGSDLRCSSTWRGACLHIFWILDVIIGKGSFSSSSDCTVPMGDGEVEAFLAENTSNTGVDISSVARNAYEPL